MTPTGPCWTSDWSGPHRQHGRYPPLSLTSHAQHPKKHQSTVICFLRFKSRQGWGFTLQLTQGSEKRRAATLKAGDFTETETFNAPPAALYLSLTWFERPFCAAEQAWIRCAT